MTFSRRCAFAVVLLLCSSGLAAALHMWPETVTAQIPMLQPYRYATLGKLLLVVNPDDRKIVDIISPWKIVDVARP